jgi:Glycogen debranching enzyme
MDSSYICDSKWISQENSSYDENKIFLFRRNFNVNEENVKLCVRVSADSRYKLYVNEKLVSLGPCKGDRWITHYETVDLTDYLDNGCNIISAEVLHFANFIAYSGNHKEGPFSIRRTSKAAFLLEGILLDKEGNVIEDLSTDTKWKVQQEEGIRFITPSFSEISGAFEHVDFKNMTQNWRSKVFDDAKWMSAEVITSSFIDKFSAGKYGSLTPWILKESPIPQLIRVEKHFESVTKADIDKNILTALLLGKVDIRILPGTCCSFELDAGELTTGYLKLKIENGKGSIIKILYSECYESDVDGRFIKQVRDNNLGVLRGDYDLLELDGRDINYETYWFRTFRFIRIEVSTGAQELLLKDIHYLETGYPLETEGAFESSDRAHSKMWDISLRTLKRCMHETYEDCPYYEQLQYIMDSRLEMLFTYQISRDDRLARKCINDFHSSLNPDGLLHASYPSILRQIIPGFCLHWIFMLEDHLMYFGDIDFIKKYRPTMDAVLGWFDRRIMGNGLIGTTGYWAFVDWVEGWDQSSVPTANRVGPITVYSLMYACALQSAAYINKITGREGISKEYLTRIREVISAVNKCCYDENKKLFTDGPSVPEFSQHVQVWAVLCGAVEEDEARNLMLRMLGMDISKVSYAMSFFLFRALEKSGLYSKVDDLMDPWRTLISMNLTTWVEDPVTLRSECHGWGAVQLYEFPAMILGVKPAGLGYGKIKIQPHIGKLKYAKGVVSTIRGAVSVDWKIEGNIFEIEIISGEDIEKIVVLPDKSVHEFRDSVISLKCCII